jgi:DNA-binding GntR family transcriptional regulator
MIDPEGPVPVWRQLYELLRAKIETGEYPPNRMIPSARSLAETYGVARGTVVKAVDALVTDGYVTGVPGRGMFVIDRGRAE